MPNRVKPRYYGMPVPPGRVAGLAQEHVDSRNGSVVTQHLPGIAWPSSAAQAGAVGPAASARSSMVPDGGIRACDRERTKEPDGKRSAARGQRVADVQASVTKPVTGEPGLRHAACRRADRRFRIVGT